MFRGTTARTVVSILAAVLLALPFVASSTSFASAHTARHVEAKDQPGIKPSAKALRDEIATCRDNDHTEDPTGPLHNRDRHRYAGCVPGAPERPVLTQDPAAPGEPVRPRVTYERTSRPSAAHTPAALQVFRC